MDLKPYYGWIVFVHVAAAFAFATAHGVSVFASFRIRAERDPSRIAALLDLSSTSLATMYGSLLTLFVAGILAGIVGDWFGRLWIWLALVMLIAVVVAMYAVATRYYATIRAAVGMPAYNAPKDQPPAPASPDELARLLDTRRPDAIAAIGFGGLAIILWLMVLKPF